MTANSNNRLLPSRQLPVGKYRIDIPRMLSIGLMDHPWTKKKPAATMSFLSRNNSQTTTRPDVRPKEIAAVPTTAGVEHTMQELPVPRAQQVFFWWVSAMMRYVPESTQKKALNAAKSNICDILSEVMVKIAVPP